MAETEGTEPGTPEPITEDRIGELVEAFVAAFRRNPTAEGMRTLVRILQTNPVFQENEDAVIDALRVAGMDVEIVEGEEEEREIATAGGERTEEGTIEDPSETMFADRLLQAEDVGDIAEAFAEGPAQNFPGVAAGGVVGPLRAELSAAQPMASLLPRSASALGPRIRRLLFGTTKGGRLARAGGLGAFLTWVAAEMNQQGVFTPQEQDAAITDRPPGIQANPMTVWFTHPQSGEIIPFNPATIQETMLQQGLTPAQAQALANESDLSNTATTALGPATEVTSEQALEAQAVLADPDATPAELEAAIATITMFNEQPEETAFGGFEMRRTDPFADFINPTNRLGRETVQDPFQLRPRPPNIPEGVTGPPVAEHMFGERLPGREIPGGANLAPAAFSDYQGRPLIAWAQGIAARYQVPLNILYAMIDYESNWNPQAQGDHEGGRPTSFGLAQIHLTSDAFGGQVTRSQALDPLFALDFAARRLRESYNKFGTWEAAVANHNSPRAANYLAETGQWYNEKSQKYTTDILSIAQGSGLSNTWFDASNIDFPQAGIGEDFGGAQAVFPVEGGTLPGSSQIGLPRDGGRREHKGIDLMADRGTNVRASVSGTIRYAENRGGNGGYAVSIVDERGNWHYYAHLDPSSSLLWEDNAIKAGAHVQAGTIIGYVGNTGNARGGPHHLHYSINEGRSDAALIDPFDFLQQSPTGPLPGPGAPGTVEPAPFVAPDRATSEDFLMDIYMDILGRDPTDEELVSGIDKIRGFAETNYDRTIRGERGLDPGGPQIDPSARLTRSLEESEEAAFVEKRDLSANFTDYVANLIEIMRGT